MVVNLYDLTGGNYHISRTITYPDYPKSKIVTEGEVKATKGSEWNTDISINGTYNGPTDVAAVKDYQLIWTSDGKNIHESGSATLKLKSGRSVRQVWKSTITPEHRFYDFPKVGELITISFSPFKIDGNSMSYKWEGMAKVPKLNPDIE